MPNNSNPANLADELTNQASLRPEAIAIRLRASDISFRQLEILTWRAATFLHRNGTRAGDVVALSFANELTLIIAMLATARIGATAFSVPAGSPPILQAEMVAKAKARILATDIADADAGGLPRLFVDVGFLAKHSTSVDTSVRDKHPQAPWLIITGSGSTGRPKQIPVTHSVFRERMLLYSDQILTSPSDCVVSLIHSDFTLAKNQYLNALFEGASICLFDRANTNPIDICRRRQVTILYAAVMHVEQLLNRLPAGSINVLSSIRALVPAGSVVSDGLRQRILEILTPNLYIRYATNETGSITAVTPQEVFSVSGTVGRPHLGVRVEVVDPNGIRLPPGEIGQIRIQSPGMINNYLNDDEATERAFKDGWFQPGDIGKFTPDGQLVFLGRADQMMIMDGINIYPAEIEAVVGRHPAVRDSAAIPLHSPLHQNIPVCAVALHRGKVASETDLLEFTFQRLGSRYPRRVIILEEIPRTKQGKLLLNELSQEIADKLRRPA